MTSNVWRPPFDRTALDQVKYLEGQLIKRTREHDDHTASLKQVNKLDREVEGLRKCLQERRVEALVGDSSIFRHPVARLVRQPGTESYDFAA